MTCRFAPFAFLLSLACIATGCAASASRASTPPTARERLRANGETVVQVVQPTTPADAPDGLGTGLVVDRRGYVLTNFHIVEPMRHPTTGAVISDGTFLVCTVPTGVRDCDRADLVAADPKNELALLKTKKRTFKTAATFANDIELERGDFVSAWGNIAGIAPVSPLRGAFINWMTAAYLGIKGDEISFQEGRTIKLPLLLLDLPMNNGTSGGPVFREDGACVGLLFATIKTADLATPIGMAIPASRVIPFLKKHLPPPDAARKKPRK